MRGLIVAGGPVCLAQLQAELTRGNKLIIAADSGGRYLYGLEVLPDILVGDFDSLTMELLQKFQASGVKIVRFSPEKDQTDLELAIDIAINSGVTDLTIIGGLGNRLDHTLANIGLLLFAQKRGISARLIDETQELALVGKRSNVKALPGRAISLIPLTAAVKGINTAGLVYPLNNETLYFDAGRGVHNGFCASEAVIEVEEGILLMIIFKEE